MAVDRLEEAQHRDVPREKDRKNGPLWCFRATAGMQELEQRMGQRPSRNT